VTTAAIDGRPPPPLVTDWHPTASVSFTTIKYVPGLSGAVSVGAVTQLRDGRVKLIARAYVPAVASDESIAILGSDVSDLIVTIDHNLSSDSSAGMFQRRVAYDNLPAEAINEIHGKRPSPGLTAGSCAILKAPRRMKRPRDPVPRSDESSSA
jgi:hypothetical protein